MSQPSGPSASIVLRAPEGEVGWKLVELQGTCEARNGGVLDGMELGKLVRDVRPRSPPNTLAAMQ